jgi:hypothetical protein
MTTLRDQWTTLYAAGRVRWMPGMMDESGTRVLHVKDDGRLITDDLVDNGAAWQSYREHDVITPDTLYAPDFADPATEGCLLHQAREAWGDMTAHIHGCLWDMNGDVVPPQWTMIGVTPPVGQSVVGWHLTEPAAILAAIAAAPPKVTE